VSLIARRSVGRPDDDEGVTHPQVRPDPAFGLLKLYDDALPHVYGYLLARCGDISLAEELTAESFLAAETGLTPAAYFRNQAAS
jgi:hypothetical protein